MEYRTIETVNKRIQEANKKDESALENKTGRLEEEKKEGIGRTNTQFYRVADFTIWEIEK